MGKRGREGNGGLLEMEGGGGGGEEGGMHVEGTGGR